MNIDKSSMSFKEKLKIARNRLNSENQSSTQINNQYNINDGKNTQNQVSDKQIFDENNNEKIHLNSDNQKSLKIEQNKLEQSPTSNNLSNPTNQFNCCKSRNQENQIQTRIMSKSEMSFKEKLQLASDRLSRQNQNITQINTKSIINSNINIKNDITKLTKSQLQDDENDDIQLEANEIDRNVNSTKIKINQLIKNTQEKLDSLLQKSEKIDFNAFLQQKIDEILPLIQIDFQKEEKVIDRNNEIRKEILESTTIFEKKYCIILKESYKLFLKTVVLDVIKRICINLPNNLISKIYIAKVQSMEKEIAALTSFIDDIYVEKVGKDKNENKMNEKEINSNSLFYVMSENESYREIKIQITCSDNIQQHIPQDF